MSGDLRPRDEVDVGEVSPAVRIVHAVADEPLRTGVLKEHPIGFENRGLVDAAHKRRRAHLRSPGAEEVLGAARPAVRIHVARDEVAIEGHSTRLSAATAHRYACAAGIVPILFERDQVLDLGRTRRLFTPRQRIALAARDGGCRFPGCDRPPTWCEAHHIRPWSRGGPTDLRDGVLLCRHHHLLVHDNGWEVTRTGDRYALVPPANIDPTRAPRPAPPRPPVRHAA